MVKRLGLISRRGARSSLYYYYYYYYYHYYFHYYYCYCCYYYHQHHYIVLSSAQGHVRTKAEKMKIKLYNLGVGFKMLRWFHSACRE